MKKAHKWKFIINFKLNKSTQIFYHNLKLIILNKQFQKYLFYSNCIIIICEFWLQYKFMEQGLNFKEKSLAFGKNNQNVNNTSK